MSRLRAIAERDRIDEAAAQIEAGETVDWDRLGMLQTLDMVRAGRASLLDALDRTDETDGDIEGICGAG